MTAEVGKLLFTGFLYHRGKLHLRDPVRGDSPRRQLVQQRGEEPVVFAGEVATEVQPYEVADLRDVIKNGVEAPASRGEGAAQVVGLAGTIESDLGAGETERHQFQHQIPGKERPVGHQGKAELGADPGSRRQQTGSDILDQPHR